MTATKIANDRLNEYTPDGSYAPLTEREKMLCRNAFEAGRRYESALTPEDYLGELTRLRALLPGQ